MQRNKLAPTLNKQHQRAVAMDLREHLSRQLQFLHLSSASYDAGYKDEAVRIGTTIRVLLHDTQRSVSLLTHLDAKKINLLSTCRSDLDFWGVSHYVGMGLATVTPNGTRGFEPSLGNGPTREFVLVDRWWNQIVFVTGRHSINRMHIVLGAANKDGGAHVDPKLSAEYEALMNIGDAKLVPDLAVFSPLVQILAATRDAHFMSLRQMAYELLNSPELLALRGST